MWLWLDRTASILFDATLSTALFLSVVVLFLFVCRQPARRLMIVRWSLIASLAMLPLVAMAPLPRLDVLAIIRHADLIPKSLPVKSVSDEQTSAELPAIEGRLHSFITAFRGDYSAWLHRWMPALPHADRADSCCRRRSLGVAGLLGGSLAAAPFSRAVAGDSGSLRLIRRRPTRS